LNFFPSKQKSGLDYNALDCTPLLNNLPLSLHLVVKKAVSKNKLLGVQMNLDIQNLKVPSSTFLSFLFSFFLFQFFLTIL